MNSQLEKPTSQVDPTYSVITEPFANHRRNFSSAGWHSGLEQDAADFDLQSVINPLSRRNPAAQSLLLSMAMTFRANNISAMYRVASEKNGSFVTIDRRFGFLPLLWGKDQRPVPVYDVVEEIEAILDYDELKSRFPTLSYTQVSATVGFLRSLAQFNSKNVDIDALQDDEIESSQRFQDVVMQAMEDKEVMRVLAPL